MTFWEIKNSLSSAVLLRMWDVKPRFFVAVVVVFLVRKVLFLWKLCILNFYGYYTINTLYYKSEWCNIFNDSFQFSSSMLRDTLRER